MNRYKRTYWQRIALAIVYCLSCGTLASAQSASKPAGGNKPSGATNRNNARPNVRSQAIPKATVPQTVAPAQAISKATSTAPKAASVLEKDAVAVPAGEKFTLKHRLKSGEVLRTRTMHVVNAITRVQGAEDISESKSISDKVWEVQAVDAEGLMTFEYRIDAVDMSQKQTGQEEITYNSRTDKSAPDKFGPLAETIAKPIAVVTIDATGTVIERDKQSKTPALGMGELAIPLPKEAVAVGAHWSIPRECRVKLENGTQKVIKLREQYTLENASAGVATIRVQTQPITPVDEPAVEAQLMQQMSQGVIKFDMDHGRLISKQLDWDAEVVGFRGAETSLKYTARFTEERSTDTIQSASKPVSKKR